MIRQYFQIFMFYLAIVKMRQVSIAVSEFTHSIKQPFVRFILKNVNNSSPSMQAAEITLYEALK